MAEPVRPFPVWPRPLRSLLNPLRTSAAGMSTQQRFLDTISANIANAETTRTADGTPYARQVTTVERDPRTGALVTRTQADGGAGRVEYDPGHPDADANGFVHYPNVDVTTELVDLMIARRMHEANASVFQAAKAMVRKALEI